MKKVDLKKEFKNLYNSSSKEIEIVKVPMMNFLMIDGIGDPNTSKAYSDSIETLYSVSYSIKFILKKEKEIDYVVMPLEGLWWAEDMGQFSTKNKDKWKWTSMIMQPDFVDKKVFEMAFEQVKIKKNLLMLSKIRFQSFNEGLSVQIMHIGPYFAEAPKIEKLHKFVKESGHNLRGKHHEIYLSDPRKTAPERIKTIIRQPIEPIVL
ncbi:MAG: hypothetical protein COS15_01835 [Caldiserica bacterium CG02_land_8_20_14_3_00_36_38]|nr:hypothetical protein [Caldisericota bacterium]PIP49879.1 MAG: hypothetical protein COX13_01470 [Caldiserica bacterium CG23_combo_of_CG06-09_8_20_14_all_35_60]PIV56312.1 MAG: hypothetical protein COS15_01835 [Caldiserica bacterium CG02_land_8_20_14_3_00_36_38]PIX29592.1 MAG: hypothetical protein COZ65_01470 [Caldiserica bacterium CG_4_8_14_3_um_filter_35_18]